MSEWISVKERLPQEMTTVLVYRPDRGWAFAQLSNGFWFPTGDTKVTHWMPLPSPPKEEPK